ncbi:hypothetical protein MASR2M79_02530 [Aminivibrio sp.]
MAATLTMDEFHNPKDKDGTRLPDIATRAVFFKKIAVVIIG